MALKIEKSLLKLNPNKIENVNNIISTYMNQAVICSEMKKHENSSKIIETAFKILGRLDYLLKEEKKKESEKYNENYQGFLYLKMVCSFNMAVESEYLFNFGKAILFYEDALTLGKELNNSDVVKKSEIALSKLNKKREK